jgi:hypothetical protein
MALHKNTTSSAFSALGPCKRPTLHQSRWSSNKARIMGGIHTPFVTKKPA